MTSKKIETIYELTDMVEDEEFLTSITYGNLKHINVAIIPQDTGELTEPEDIIENDLDENNIIVDDISGSFELFLPEAERNQGEEMSSSANCSKKRKEEKIKWQNISPVYTKTTVLSKDKIEVVRQKLEKLSVVEIFEYMFSDKVFQLIIDQSEIYAKQNNVTNFSLSLDDLKKFIGILLISGYRQMPHEDMYFDPEPDCKIPIVFDSMTRSRFLEIKRYFHLNDNSKLVTTDKFYKLRNFFDLLKDNFLQFGVFSSMLCIDEMMVPYYGKYPTKIMEDSYIKFGYKIYCLCSSNGYLFNFEPYEGKPDNINESILESHVVERLIDVIPSDTIEDHEVFFDKFFTSHELLKNLGKIKLKATGTIYENRIKQCPLMPCKEMEKRSENGYYEKQFDTENEILFARWKHNKTTTIASNYSDVLPLENIKRFSIKDWQSVIVPIPRLLREYNKNLDGVDLLDEQISLYRTRFRSKKWWWPLFIQFLDVAVTNTCHLYQLSHPWEKVKLLDIRRELVLCYLSGAKSNLQSTDP